MADTLQRRPLTLQELPRFDNGMIALLWDKATAVIAHDCEQRPSCKGAREVILSIKIKPTLDDQGESSGWSAVFSVDTKTPKQQKTYHGVGVDRGCLMVNAGAPDNFDQHTLLNDEESK